MIILEKSKKTDESRHRHLAYARIEGGKNQSFNGAIHEIQSNSVIEMFHISP